MKKIYNLIKRLWTGSILRQLIFGFMLLYSIVMLTFIYDITHRQQQFLSEQNIQHSNELASTLASVSAQWLLTEDIANLEELLNSQKNHQGLISAKIIDRNGRVIAGVQNQSLVTEAGEFIITANLPHQNEPLSHISEDEIKTSKAILANGNIIGWVNISISQEYVHTTIQQVLNNGIFYTSLALVLGFIIAYLIAKGLTSGLTQLVKLSESIRDGKHQTRVDIDRYDEIGRLASNFNLMLDTLAARNHILDETKNQLSINQRRLELALVGGNYGLWDWDMVSDKVYYSDKWREQLGISNHAPLQSIEEWKSRIHPDDKVIEASLFSQHQLGLSPLYESSHRVLHENGEYRWHLAKGIVERDINNRPIRFTGTSSDITDIKISEQQHYEASERFRITLKSIADAVITTDSFGNVQFINPSAEKILGYSSDELYGMRFSEYISFMDDQSNEIISNPIDTCIHQNEVAVANNNVVILNKSREKIFVEATAAPILDQHKQLIGAVMVIHDVSLTHELSKHMAWQATHDPLTGLVNRREFERLLNHAIANSDQSNNIHGLLYLDLDQFKLVNDTCGHAAGDILLKQLTFLLREELDTKDVLARLGGDEFGVLLYNQSLEQCIAMADKLRSVVKDYRFAWQNMAFDIGVSIGIVQITPECENLTRVLSAADMACYAAKDSGRNRYHIFERSDKDLMRKQGEMQWTTKITDALSENRFQLYCQAIKPIAAQEDTHHIEILVRMIDKDGDIVPPGAFIPAAERYNFMSKLDHWVYENTLKTLSEYIEHGLHQNVMVSINLSGQTLGDESFQKFVFEKLQQYDISPKNICFEVTETSAIQNLNKAARFIKEMKKHGCLFSLDDFGSGISSFGYLKRLAVDFLKIDGGFVKDIVDDPIDHSMVKAINEIGHTLNLHTIAEFVENDAILKSLADIGVDYAQGYGLEKPLPLQDKLNSLLE